MDPVLKFTEQYPDVLQNIEFTIVEFHRGHPDLLDYDVEGVMDALISDLKAEQRGQPVPERRLPGLRQMLIEHLREVCEWRLGRASLLAEDGPPSRIITADEMVACLNRIRKSVRKWTKEGGRQGYLRFIRQYVG